MKKTFLSLCLSGLLTLGAYAHTNKPANPVKAVPGPGTVYHRTLKQGEQDLMLAAQKSKTEDKWLYINNKWHDIGVNEDSNSVTSRLELIVGIIFEDLPRDNIVCVYHIHPINSGNDKRNVYAPTAQDVFTHLLFREFICQISRCELKSRMCDGYGIWEYDMDVDINKLENQDLFKANLDMECALLKEKIWSQKLPRDEQVRQFIAQSKEKLGINLSYKPIILSQKQ